LETIEPVRYDFHFRSKALMAPGWLVHFKIVVFGIAVAVVVVV
jgi:hypothetical protein